MSAERCNCQYCNRNRVFVQIVEKYVTEEVDKAFMRSTLETLLDAEMDVEYFKDQQTSKPKPAAK